MRAEQALAQSDGVALGQMGIPALGRTSGPFDAEPPLKQGFMTAPQPPANAEQAVVAHADPPADDVKAHKAGSTGV
jgi:hypothetical protein